MITLFQYIWGSWNWVDTIIIVVLSWFIFQAWIVGVWTSIANFFTFLLALIGSFVFYRYMGNLFVEVFHWSEATSKALGFLAVSLLIEIIVGSLLSYAIARFNKHDESHPHFRILSLIPSIGQGLILISFVLMLIITLPITPSIKTQIVQSAIGGWMISQTSGLEQTIEAIFGEAIEESLTYKITKPGSTESVPLEIDSFNLSVDTNAERELFELVNDERISRNLPALVYDDRLSEVARNHSKDMWERKYFSHYSPDGFNIADRLEQVDYVYTLAGENLALAPTVKTAHLGLMNSTGHRENILRPEFRSMGIGVIDNGYYGKMFTQVFSDVQR
ncbi:hypothetical protein HGA91_06535 [candidate division WWE3 bacterium]|nr:hypothetical protein [candidate division WWE3 bacterium]